MLRTAFCNARFLRGLLHTEVAKEQHAKISEAFDYEYYTRKDLDDSFLLDNIFTKPFKISYTIEEGKHTVKPTEVETKIRKALETWLAPLRKHIGEDADKIVTASDIVLVNETGNYTHSRRAYRKEDAGERESLTVVHVMQHRGGFILLYHPNDPFNEEANEEGTAAWADVYLRAKYINDESGEGQRITTHEFGHMFELDDTYKCARHVRTCFQDEKNREYYASLNPNKEQPANASDIMSNRYTGKLHPPSIMQRYDSLTPDDVCGIVEVYADRHLAKNGTKRRDLYRKMKNKLKQYGFECVWSP